MSNKVSRFFKEVLAQLTGDESQAVALKNARKGESAFNGQLAALEAKAVDDESAVEDATEAYTKAKFPKNLITDNKSYISNVKYAYENLERTKEVLADTKKSIEFFKKLRDEVTEQVDA